MPSRRGGRKSHHGCQNCKKRHLKCDEQIPTCSRCLKRNELCVRTYSPFRNTSPRVPGSAGNEQWATATTTAYGPHLATSSTATPSAVSRDVTPGVLKNTESSILPGICSRLASLTPDHPASSPSGIQDGDWLDDMLIQHYTSVVGYTLNEDPRVIPLYTQYLPELAKKHAQLKHGILAISGAHCVAALSDRQEVIDKRSIQALVERSLHHNSMMLGLFAQQIAIMQHDDTQEISNEECVQITMASIIVMASFVAQLHSAFSEYAHDTPRPIDKAVALLNLVGPIATFFERYATQLTATELRVYDASYLPDLADGVAPVPEEASQGLNQLVVMCSAPTISQHARLMYTAALLGLQKTYKTVAADQATIGGRFLWAHGEVAAWMANDIYKRTPEALVLLAFWAASLVPWPHWWGTDFAKKLIVEISESLPPDYMMYMVWPRSRLTI